MAAKLLQREACLFLAMILIWYGIANSVLQDMTGGPLSVQEGLLKKGWSIKYENLCILTLFYVVKLLLVNIKNCLSL